MRSKASQQPIINCINLCMHARCKYNDMVHLLLKINFDATQFTAMDGHFFSGVLERRPHWKFIMLNHRKSDVGSYPNKHQCLFI